MALPTKVLIANRGEVVVRVARTCRDLGIPTVAVFSDADRDALHARVCDEGIHLPGDAPADTYLRIDLLLAAAERTGADAVHPGFGFLAEDPDLARAVIEAGLTWIGPPPGAIAAMGDKLAAKVAMEAAGVPLLPSAAIESDPDRDTLLGLADEVGLPVIVKAAAGGGGKGMRVVHDRLEVVDAVSAARRESGSAFGDDRVFIERYVTRPRHLEVQVVGDTRGQVLHLFERECSIQRRHQKVVEETPSPAIDDAVRSALTDAAIAAAKAIEYVGAGTVEFVVDESLLARRRAGEAVDPRETFAFLEMNTRLQVEHPITEEVVRVAAGSTGGVSTGGVSTGGASIGGASIGGASIDLVRLQLLVASGAPLPFAQQDLTQHGHAIEVRLYAEDPRADHLPATGHLDVFEPDPSIRWDVGVAAGEDVGPHYDPMLAKAIAHAPTRAEAAARLAAALARTPIAGVTTNQDLLAAILVDEAFLAGDTTTSYLDERGELLLAGPDPGMVERAAVCTALHDALRRHELRALLPGLPVGFAPTGTFDPQITLLHDDPITVRYRRQRDGRWRVRLERDTAPGAWTPLHLEDGAQDVEVVAHGPDHLDVEVAGHRTRARVVAAGDTRLVGLGGRWVRFTVEPRFPLHEQEIAPGASVSPMPGKVTSLVVGVGDRVAAGDLLLTVEAMKMEHRLTASVAGTVAEVRVKPGDQVEADEVLVVVDDGAGGDAGAEGASAAERQG